MRRCLSLVPAAAGSLELRAPARGPQVALVALAEPIIATDRTVRRAERSQPGQACLELRRCADEVATVSAAPDAGHCPSLVQKSANTCVESTNPSTRLT